MIRASPIHHSAMTGDIQAVKELVRGGADVNMIFKTVPPLYIAAMCNNTNVARALLDAHCDVNATTIELQQTALHCAVSKGYMELCRLLSDNGADLNQADHDGATPLMLAASRGQTSVLRYLISLGADMNKPDNRGLTPLASAVQNASTPAVEVLLQSGAALDVRDKHGNTELFHAVKGGQTAICRALVRARAGVNMRNANNEYPISIAAMYGNSPITEILIQGGCDVNVVSPVMGTPLYAAVDRQHINVVRMLINAGADACVAGPKMRLPLTEALHQHTPNRDIILELLRAGCDIDAARCDCHDSPLNMVLSKASIPIVFLLMQVDSKAGTVPSAKLDELSKYCSLTYAHLSRYESARVCSLSGLCRKVIKRSCGSVRYRRRVDALPAPTAIKRYLMHDDVPAFNADDFKCPDAMTIESRFRRQAQLQPMRVNVTPQRLNTKL